MRGAPQSALRTWSSAKRQEGASSPHIAGSTKLDYFEQLEALAAQQGGYFYPWRSALGDGNGEDAYTQLVESHLSLEKIVLDAGCGHGTDMLAFAPKVRRFIGYDAVESFIAIARRRADEVGLASVALVLSNSSPDHNGGAARIPAADHTLDLIISRRGPTNWIADARRVCRPGARLIQVNPLPSPEPAWKAELPQALRTAGSPANPGRPDLVGYIKAALAAADLRLEDGQVFDAPEVISEPEDLYRCLTFMRFEPNTPSWDAARPHLERLLARHGAVDMRQRRFLWTAVVD